jgi:hypothetical protein
MLILLENLKMLYHLILYEYPSGKPIIEHTFKEIIKDEAFKTLSSFLVSLKLFAQELIKKKDKLDFVKFGDLIIRLEHISEISIDLALVFDSDNKKIMTEMVPKIKELILEYETLFMNWNGVDVNQFSLLKEALLKSVREVIYKLSY